MHEISLNLIENGLRSNLNSELSRTALLCRLHSRIKEKYSIDEKIERKQYAKSGKLIQDLIGFRITTFFYEDLLIIAELCKKNFNVIDFVNDKPTDDQFCPQRRNMICELPHDLKQTYLDFKRSTTGYELTDGTFEIQFRTTLSEGWHEVDHMLRYKCKPDWNYLQDESRVLNGIYATLETSDHALKSLFKDIAYHHYKKRNWEAMLRNKMLIKFGTSRLSTTICDYFNENPEMAKRFFRINRKKTLVNYIDSTKSFSSTFDHWIYYINLTEIEDRFLNDITPEYFIRLLE
ncbi:MAG: hypothetical protein AMXMBFR48_24060 [Ignavibacteriales bacterium]